MPTALDRPTRLDPLRPQAVLRAMLTERVTPPSRDEWAMARHRSATSSIEAALARIEAGTYGVCTRCDARIPRVRLEIVPTASTCARCPDGTGRPTDR